MGSKFFSKLEDAARSLEPVVDPLKLREKWGLKASNMPAMYKDGGVVKKTSSSAGTRLGGKKNLGKAC